MKPCSLEVSPKHVRAVFLLFHFCSFSGRAACVLGRSAGGGKGDLGRTPFVVQSGGPGQGGGGSCFQGRPRSELRLESGWRRAARTQPQTPLREGPPDTLGGGGSAEVSVAPGEGGWGSEPAQLTGRAGREEEEEEEAMTWALKQVTALWEARQWTQKPEGQEPNKSWGACGRGPDQTGEKRRQASPAVHCLRWAFRKPPAGVSAWDAPVLSGLRVLGPLSEASPHLLPDPFPGPPDPPGPSNPPSSALPMRQRQRGRAPRGRPQGRRRQHL